MPSEADTCRVLVVPKLQAAGWERDPHSIAEQRTITDGRIVPAGKGFVRKPPKRVDYLLRYTRDFPLAVVEAKAAYKAAADGLQQAKQYAEMLGLKFAYATNGYEIIEFDYFSGIETRRADYPTPAELWQRYLTGSDIGDPGVAARLLTPSNHQVGKDERYYQQIAVNRSVEYPFSAGPPQSKVSRYLSRREGGLLGPRNNVAVTSRGVTKCVRRSGRIIPKGKKPVVTSPRSRAPRARRTRGGANRITVSPPHPAPDNPSCP